MIETGFYAFVNAVPSRNGMWSHGSLDHTEDENGYMLVLNTHADRTHAYFNITVPDLCAGFDYAFSAYLANILNPKYNETKPNIYFEACSITVGNNSCNESEKTDIQSGKPMPWFRHGVVFTARSSSVVLSIIPTTAGMNGRNIAIDDVELRVCSNDSTGLCPSGLYIDQ